MYLSRPARWILRGFSVAVLGVLYFPLLYVMRLSIATTRGFTFPPGGWTLEHWSAALDARAPRDALGNSLVIAGWATAVALLLGSLAAAALHRFRFFGRN